MELAIIILLSLIFVALIVLVIVNNARKIERLKYHAAAGNILREGFLNYSLQNSFISGGDLQEPRGKKTMIYLKSKHDKKARFVFDPEKAVYIGRDKYISNIYVNDITVSQNHCCIYSVDDHVYLKDCNSANGTVVIRGLFNRYTVAAGSKTELMTGDKIEVGSVTFAVTLFYYDMSTM